MRAFVHHGRSDSPMARELAVISVTVHPRCAKPAFRVPMGVVRPLYGLVGRSLYNANRATVCGQQISLDHEPASP